MRHRLAALMAALALPTIAHAAQIDLVRLPGPPHVALRIGQVIQQGDAAAFHALAASVPEALVVLSGPGGSVAAAIAIGQEIQARRFTTLVPADTDCASACALIWLAGRRRMLGSGARIGFHAISFRQDNGALIETHVVDDVLRGYLNGLGFEADAQATITRTPSAMIRWLDPVELQANGIDTVPYP